MHSSLSAVDSASVARAVLEEQEALWSEVQSARQSKEGTEATDRLLREARSLAVLRHPSIVPVHEVGHQASVPFLVSPFIPGSTLAARVAEPSGSATVLRGRSVFAPPDG